MKYIVIFDSWKGCMGSGEANFAAMQGIHDADPSAEVVCLLGSDGGEGMLDAFVNAMGGSKVAVRVHDPLMRLIDAEYGLSTDGETAIIEVARACGLHLLRPAERNPLLASSYGVGELVLDAFNRGCRHFIIGLGGSGTSDAGIGMLEAFMHSNTTSRRLVKGDWRTASIDSPSLQAAFEHIIVNNLSSVRLISDNTIDFLLATDVKNPLYGPNGAACVFAPQKGATDEMVEAIDRRARVFSSCAQRLLACDKSLDAGAGAAGGLGYAFMQFLGAMCCSGIDLLLDQYHFETLLASADYVLTGEGSSDLQTLMGKLPYGVMRRASAMHIPTLLFAGRLSHEAELRNAGFDCLSCINPSSLPLCEAMRKDVAMKNLRETVRETIGTLASQR